MFNCFYSLSRFCSDVLDLLICTFDAYFIKLFPIKKWSKLNAVRSQINGIDLCCYFVACSIICIVNILLKFICNVRLMNSDCKCLIAHVVFCNSLNIVCSF